ncbi:hypothetical protein ACLOJK_035336 [Asimina triloba]
MCSHNEVHTVACTAGAPIRCSITHITTAAPKPTSSSPAAAWQAGDRDCSSVAMHGGSVPHEQRHGSGEIVLHGDERLLRRAPGGIIFVGSGPVDSGHEQRHGRRQQEERRWADGSIVRQGKI